ncbi:hypothetical protein H8959_000332 [Pygathrix nigripes]
MAAVNNIVVTNTGWNGRRTSRSTKVDYTKSSPKTLVTGKQHGSKSSQLFAASKIVRRKAASLLTDAKDMELINATLKTFAPDSPVDNKKTVSGFQELKKLDPIAADQQDVVDFKVTEGKPVRDTLSGPSAEQAGMENRTLLQPLMSQMSGSVTASVEGLSSPKSYNGINRPISSHWNNRHTYVSTKSER